MPGSDFSVIVEPKIDNPKVHQAGWRLVGRVRPVCTFAPAFVELGAIVRGTVVESKAVGVHCQAPVGSLAAESKTDRIATTLRRVTEVGRAFSLEILPLDGLTKTPGPFEEIVKLTGTLEDGRSIPPQRLHVSGRIVEDLAVNPETIYLGPAALGQKLEETVTVSSRMGKTVTLESIQADDPGLVIEPLTQSPIGTRQFRIVRRAARLGHQSSNVRFLGRTDRSEERVTVRLRISYHGLPARDNAPEPALNPTTTNTSPTATND